MDHIKLTVDKLSVEEINNLVANERCGAISLFVGTTRDYFEDKKVVSLEYEAYESMAVKALKSICEEIRKKWPNVHDIAIYHRLGTVPAKEASVVIAVSSPHRREALDAVSHCIDQLKATVPIWKKEKYDGDNAVWKENKECLAGNPDKDTTPTPTIDENLIQINVSSEEIKKRIDNFISRKREQVNLSNIHDFIPSIQRGVGRNVEDGATCARVRTQFVKRTDSKGHLKIRKVENEWGPQTVKQPIRLEAPPADALPSGIADRVRGLEDQLNIKPISRDIYQRLKEMEDKLADMQAMSPEYAQFWKRKTSESECKKENDYTYSACDIDRKIELMEQQSDL